MHGLSGIFDNKGTPLEKQNFTWKDIASKPISKLDDDAFTRVRIILMNGLEQDALRLKHFWGSFQQDAPAPAGADSPSRAASDDRRELATVFRPLAAGNHSGL